MPRLAAAVFAALLCTPAALALKVAPPAEDETDKLALTAAETACKSEDFRSFFEAYVRSQAVRDAYTAAAVTVSKDGTATETPKAAYDAFPIGMIDYYWVSKASETAVLADPSAELEHLKMQFNQSQTNIWRVDWVRVRYDGKSEGGDDLGNETGTYGDPGYLLFNPTAACWELAQDTTGGPGSGLE